MIEVNQLDTQILQSLNNVKGILSVRPISRADRREVLILEEEAEKRSLMGLGKVINSGVRKVLQFDSIYVALTGIEFNWGHCSSLILMKGEQVVGEDIYDEVVIEELSKSPNAWFMHKNFVIYKDRVSFPKDIMQKICHFEIPGMPADWLSKESKDGIRFDVWYCNPSTFCDAHLKENYFDGIKEHGLGTILIGVNTLSDVGKEEGK